MIPLSQWRESGFSCGSLLIGASSCFQERQLLFSCQGPTAAGSTSYLLTPFLLCTCIPGRRRLWSWTSGEGSISRSLVPENRQGGRTREGCSSPDSIPTLPLLTALLPAVTSGELDPHWIYSDFFHSCVLGLNKILKVYQASIASPSQINFLRFPLHFSAAKINEKYLATGTFSYICSAFQNHTVYLDARISEQKPPHPLVLWDQLCWPSASTGSSCNICQTFLKPVLKLLGKYTLDSPLDTGAWPWASHSASVIREWFCQLWAGGAWCCLMRTGQSWPWWFQSPLYERLWRLSGLCLES